MADGVGGTISRGRAIGGRQQAPTLSGIRTDHVARYRWAADLLSRHLAPGSRILDAACGVGYGARLLADAGLQVHAIDGSAEAVTYGQEHYDHVSIDWRTGMLPAAARDQRCDAVVSFETLEHLDDAPGLLRAFAGCAPRLLLSVPNEDVLPFEQGRFRDHVRHYTAAQLSQTLTAAGWSVQSWWGQADAFSEVAPKVAGRTLVVVAERA